MRLNYSATELSKLKLSCIPTAKSNIISLAEKEHWSFTEVSCRGGIRREYQVPQYVLDEIIATKAEKLLTETQSAPLPALPQQSTAAMPALNSKQATVEGARKAVLLVVEQTMALAGISQRKAIETVLINAKLKGYEATAATLRLAIDNRGGAGKLPNLRTIQRWFEQRDSNNTLAPMFRTADMDAPIWAADFLSHWQKPQKPTIAKAYRDFKNTYIGELPSIYQVYRLIEKLGAVTKEHGRRGSRDMKNILPFKRRDSSWMMPTQCYTADGHTFDAEVQHPKHGQPFRPEVTAIVDVATRKAVGWSVDLAESALSVLSALTRAVTTHGIPAIFYVDNGSGYKNAMLTDEAIGLMGRLGTQMENSIAYNSQARGIIERFHQTVFVTAAKELPTYIGKDMDTEAKQKVFKITRKAVKSGMSNKLLMPFDVFLEFINQKIEEYNNRPHRSLPKTTDEAGKKRHMTPNEVWETKVKEGAEIVSVTNDEAAYLFRPQENAKVNRGEMRFLNNIYFNEELKEFHGQKLNFGYDVNDANQIWVYDDLGVLICTAEWNGNKTDYMPKSYVQSKEDKRAEGRERRAMVKVDEARLERHGTVLIEHQETISLVGMPTKVSDLAKKGQEALVRIQATQQSKQITQPIIEHVASETTTDDDQFIVPKESEARYQLYLESKARLDAGMEVSVSEREWVTVRYPRSPEYRAFSKRAVNS